MHWTIGRTSTILSSLRTNRTPPSPLAAALAETTKLGSRLTGRRDVPGGKRHSDSPGKALWKPTTAPHDTSSKRDARFLPVCFLGTSPIACRRHGRRLAALCAIRRHCCRGGGGSGGGGHRPLLPLVHARAHGACARARRSQSYAALGSRAENIQQDQHHLWWRRLRHGDDDDDATRWRWDWCISS